MQSYPIMLNMKNKNAVVVGGGIVAYRKIIGLLKAGANVIVISPTVHPQVEELYFNQQIHWMIKEFEQCDIDTALIVIAATNNRKLNEEIAKNCSGTQLVNVIDNQEHSSFQVPATLTRGKLTIAVGTGGASPILAQNIRNELAERYDVSYEDYLLFLMKSRKEILRKVRDETERRQLLKDITHINYKKSNVKQNDFLERMDAYNGRAEK
ncbi:precorrin-2 dehydrogenase/sirohydrochlorin ferrochelatase family protein [Bacillus sp. FSL K6-3431]|uniref:precorrin-2 dehydrogenase/sirohydrochlorin ferrochelatase family protein n=1 Tax=Bacillus sp. FSL K6-3431 TaxID=2921500 RepID=UPI0030F5447A